MKNRERKEHKKGQESTIGKIIYGFLLFMPLLAIGVTCLVNVWNKNKVETQEEITYTNISNFNDLKVGKWYTINTDNTPFTQTTSQSLWIYFDEIEIINFPTSVDTTNLGSVRILQYNNNIERYRFYFYDNEGSFVIDNIVNINETNANINFRFLSMGFSQNYSLFSQIFYTTSTNETTNVNDIFYYAVDRVEESNLFNWAQNSVIYTTTNATCNALNINNTFIPLLLAYWLIISIIYFLYDIALMLVWIVHRKIHEIQESI